MFPQSLKLANVTPVYEKDKNEKILKMIIGQWVSYPAYLKAIKRNICAQNKFI